MVMWVTVRELDQLGNHSGEIRVPLEKGADGRTYAVITPLVMGQVDFLINAAYRDNGASADEMSARVGPPTVAPKAFVADLGMYSSGWLNQIITPLKQEGVITPVIVFASTPDKPIILRNQTTFRVLPGDGDPVIAMHQDGTYTPLRPGRARVEIGFAGLTTQTDVVVTPQ